MKRFFAMLLAMAMMGTTAYGAESVEYAEPLYMSISRFGEIAYFLDQEKIDAYTTFLDGFLEENGNETGEKYNYNGSFYRIILHSAEERENPFTPYIDNALKIYTVYSKPIVEVTDIDGETREFYLSAEEQKALKNFVNGLVQNQLYYDTYLDFDIKGPARLGMILNNRELHYFEDAYIDRTGKIYVSLTGWNDAFLKQYGNTKQLSYQNGKVVCGNQDMKIVPVLKEGKVFLPLRETADVFDVFTVKWDAELKKAVIYEKWYDIVNEG